MATQAVVPAAASATTSLVTTLEEAPIAGYKIVDENGKPVYCREQLKTGSHVRKETICLTAEELAAAREASRRNVAQMQRAAAIPQGH